MVVIASVVPLLGMGSPFIGIDEFDTVWFIGIGEFGTIDSGVVTSARFKFGILPKADLFLRPTGPEICPYDSF